MKSNIDERRDFEAVNFYWIKTVMQMLIVNINFKKLRIGLYFDNLVEIF